MNKERILQIGMALCAASAIYFNLFDIADEVPSLGFIIFKPLTTILVLFLATFGNLRTNYGKRVFIGLLFCLLGDVLLVPEHLFVFGLASFLIAHLFFLAAFYSEGGFKAKFTPLVVLVPIGVIYYAILFKHLDDLVLPVLVYFVAILIMCWQGINLYLVKKSNANYLVAVAVCLFLFSDANLALDKFIIGVELSKITVLASYWLAISLLAKSTKR
jgi:uncharacterized membrane protein YhhN